MNTMAMMNGTNDEEKVVSINEVGRKLGLTRDSAFAVLVYSGALLQEKTVPNGGNEIVANSGDIERVPKYLVAEFRERDLHRIADGARALLAKVGVRLNKAAAIQVTRFIMQKATDDAGWIAYVQPESVAGTFLDDNGIVYDPNDFL